MENFIFCAVMTVQRNFKPKVCNTHIKVGKKIL